MTRLGKFGGGIGAVWLLTGILTSAVWVQLATAQGFRIGDTGCGQGARTGVVWFIGSGARLFSAR